MSSTTVTTKASTKRGRLLPNSREFSQLITDHSNRASDGTLRREIEAEYEAQKRQRKRETISIRSFYEKYFPFYLHVYLQWEVCTDSELIPVTNRATGNTLRYPPSRVHFPRTELHHILGNPSAPLTQFSKLQWVLERMIPDEFYAHIAQMTDESLKNYSLKKYQTSGEAAIRSLRARHLLGLVMDRLNAGRNTPCATVVVPGSTDEMKRLFFATIIFQTLNSSMTAKRYFRGTNMDDPRTSDPHIGCRRRFGIPEDRFWELRHWISFDPGVLQEILNQSFRDWVIVGGHAVAVDESLMACHSSCAPTIFISRKPHSRGLRFYLLSVKLPESSRPFCLEIMHDLSRDDRLSVSDILTRSFSHLRTQGCQLQLCGDSFFGTQDLLNRSLTEDILFTVSWSRHRCREFWDVVGTGIEAQSRGNRCVFRKTAPPMIASLFNDQKEMCVISTSIECIRGPRRTFVTQAQATPVQQPTTSTDPPSQQSGMCQSHFILNAKPCGGFASCQRFICHRCPKVHLTISEHYSIPFCTNRCLQGYMAAQDEGACQPLAREDVEKLVSKQSKELLQSLCRQRGMDTSGSKRDLAFRFAGWSEAPPQVTTAPSTSHPPPSHPSIPLTTPLINVEPSSSSSSASTSTASPLSTLSRSELIRIVEQSKIKPRSDREELQKQVEFLRLSEPEKQAMISKFSELEASVAFSPASVRPKTHTYYCEDFNSIDKFDRRSYDYYGRDNVKHFNWNLACALAFFSYGLVNTTSWIETHMLQQEAVQLAGNGLITPRDFMELFLQPLFLGLCPTALNPTYTPLLKKKKKIKMRNQ